MPKMNIINLRATTCPDLEAASPIQIMLTTWPYSSNGGNVTSINVIRQIK